jgi:two-component system response regulator AtoC
MAENANRQPHILIIDDEKKMCSTLKELLEKHDFDVSTANSAREGLSVLQKAHVDLIVCDVVMHDMGGLLFLSKVKNQTPVVMMTAFASVETARKAFKLGARDYLVKPFELKELLVVIKQYLGSSAAGDEPNIRNHLFDSRNPRFRELVELTVKFGPTDMPVLITGESGTGKEVIANSIYNNSRRKQFPFIKINCAAIPETLLESELFGYEKGAFTGANTRKVGKFEEANGGTIFLDEIADMPLTLQAKILRVLQEFEISRLGGQSVIDVDIRIMAASNKDIEKLIIGREFRDDLFHRLNGVHLHVPALRERPEDIKDLASFFLQQFRKKYDKNVVGLHADTVKIFQNYNWPGNIRELRNCVERAVVICDKGTILPEHLPDRFLKIEPGPSRPAGAVSLIEKMDDYRKNYTRNVIVEALRKTKGNRIEAANLLKISRKTLYNRMKELAIKNDFQ